MKVVNASIVRATAQPGVEVTFRGEGLDNVVLHLKDENIASKADADIYFHAKQIITQIAAFSDGGQA